MLSLSNAIDKEDLQNFEKRIFNFLNLNKNNINEYINEKNKYPYPQSFCIRRRK